MTPQRYRQATAALAVLLGLGLVGDLLLEGHTATPLQWLPFVAATAFVLGALPRLLASPPSWTRPSGLLAAGLGGLVGVFGIWEHVEHNALFEAEIRPTAPASEVWLEALVGGNPVLAPGAFVLGGALLAVASLERTVQGRANPT